jgi:hypothetical protein
VPERRQFNIELALNSPLDVENAFAVADEIEQHCGRSEQRPMTIDGGAAVNLVPPQISRQSLLTSEFAAGTDLGAGSMACGCASIGTDAGMGVPCGQLIVGDGGGLAPNDPAGGAGGNAVGRIRQAMENNSGR